MRHTTVTPETLHQQLCKLAKHIPLARQFDEHTRQTVINDVCISLLQRMSDGKLPSDDYDAYKNYAFISLKNQFIEIYNKRKRDIMATTEDVQDTPLISTTGIYNENTDEEAEQYKKVQLVIQNALSEPEKKLLYDVMYNTSNNSAKYIIHANGVDQNKYYRLLKKIKDLIDDEKDPVTQAFNRYVQDSEKYKHNNITQRIQYLFKQGKSQPEIQSILNCHTSTITRALNKIDKQKIKQERKIWIKEQILKMRNEGVCNKDIADKLGITKNLIFYYLDHEKGKANLAKQRANRKNK